MANKKKVVRSKSVKKATAKKVVKKSAFKKTIKKVLVKKAIAKKLVPKKAKAKKAVAKSKPVLKPVAKPATKPATKPVKLQTRPDVDYSKAITPLGDRLVVRVEAAELVTAGGLIIPSNVSQAKGYLKATVLAAGQGATSKKGMLRPLDVQKGDTVYFAEHAGTKVEFKGEELQIIHEADVLGTAE